MTFTTGRLHATSFPGRDFEEKRKVDFHAVLLFCNRSVLQVSTKQMHVGKKTSRHLQCDISFRDGRD